MRMRILIVGAFRFSVGFQSGTRRSESVKDEPVFFGVEEAPVIRMVWQGNIRRFFVGHESAVEVQWIRRFYAAGFLCSIVCGIVKSPGKAPDKARMDKAETAKPISAGASDA